MSYRTSFWTLLIVLFLGTSLFFYFHEKKEWEAFNPPLDPNWQPAPSPCDLNDGTLIREEIATSTTQGDYILSYERPVSWKNLFEESERVTISGFYCERLEVTIVVSNYRGFYGEPISTMSAEGIGEQAVETLTINGVPTTKRIITPVMGDADYKSTEYELMLDTIQITFKSHPQTEEETRRFERFVRTFGYTFTPKH